MKTAPPKTYNAKETGRIIGVDPGTILRSYRNGIIPAEIASGQCYRFDPDAVRAAFKAHAEKKQKEGPKPAKKKGSK